MIKEKITTRNSFESMVKKGDPKYLILDSLFYKYGLTCYSINLESEAFRCLGKSSQPLVSGITLLVPTSASGFPDDNDFERLITANYYESKIMGGVWISWKTHPKNWSRWQEIDQAIWRLLDTWNAAPQRY